MANYVSELAKSRNPSFYFEKQCVREDAEEARLQAEFVIMKTLDLLGVQAESNQE